jgi:flagellar hook assembly protein FlgD
MNKILLTSCLSFLMISGYAQNGSERIYHPVKSELRQTSQKIASFERQGLKRDIVGVYNYSANLDALGVGGSYFNVYMHPDSLAIEYTSGWGGPAFSSVGMQFDPKSDFWLDGVEKIGPKDAYTIDAVEVLYTYNRPQNTNADVLRLEIFDASALIDGSLVGGGDFKTLQYDSVNNKAVGPPAKTIDYDLTMADTSTANFTTHLFDNINFNVSAGDPMAITLTFIPKNPYTTLDTLFSQSPSANLKNRFSTSIYDDAQKTTETDIHNEGMYIPMSIRYNTNGQGWNGIYLPGMAYLDITRSFNVDFHMTALNTIIGVDELEDVSLQLGSIHPNPVTSVSTVNYYVDRATNINLEIHDLTGKLVMSENKGTVNRGKGEFTINASDLNAGMYYYSITSDTDRITKKFFVK